MPKWHGYPCYADGISEQHPPYSQFIQHKMSGRNKSPNNSTEAQPSQWVNVPAMAPCHSDAKELITTDW